MPETLLDIAKKAGCDKQIGMIDEASKVNPELTVIPARTVRTRKFKTWVRVALGNTTGSFRNANEGVVMGKHQYENREFETFVLNPRFECDKAVAQSDEDGAEAYIATQTSGTLEGEFQGLAKQLFYGVTNNAKGFPGFLGTYDATNMVVDATGTTDDTCSSVWLVRTGPKDVQWVWGEAGKMVFSPIREETLTDSNTPAGKYDGLVSTMLAFPGIMVGSLKSLCRIKKVTADSGKGLTDALITTALGKFPAKKGPNVIFMTRRSLTQLRNSRTATSPTGAPAPWPTSIEGMDGQPIPIEVTEALTDIEKLTD